MSEEKEKEGERDRLERRRSKSAAAAMAEAAVDKLPRGAGDSVSPESDVEPAPSNAVAQLHRSSFGQAGRECRVVANFIRLELKPMTVKVYQIDMSCGDAVDGEPISWEKGAIKSPGARRLIFYDWMVEKGHTFCEHVNDYAYDGGCMIVARLPFTFPRGAQDARFACMWRRAHASPLQLTDMIRCNTDRDVYSAGDGGQRWQTIHLRITKRKDVSIDPNNLGMERTKAANQRISTPQQMVNVILRANRTAQLDRDAGFYRKFFPVGRGVFQIPTSTQDQGAYLGRGLIHWQGLFSSVRACGEVTVPMVNFDVLNGGFHWMPGARLSDYFGEALGHGWNPIIWAGPNGGRRFNNQNELRKFQWPFRYLKVKVDHERGKSHHYVCKRLDYRTAIDIMIEWTPSHNTSPEAVAGNARVQHFLAGRASTHISVYDYFRLFYRLTLQFPFLPLAEVASRGSHRRYFPLEVASVATPQRFNGQPPKAIGKEAAKGPDHRMKSIERMVALACYVHDPFLDRFAIGLNNGLAVARARILPPPRVRFGRNFTVMPRDGVFNTERDKPIFHTPRHINSFAVIYVSSTPPHGEEQQILGAFAQHVGLNARPFQGDGCRQRAAYTGWASPVGIKAALEVCCVYSKRQAGDRKPSVVFCIMPSRDCTVYSDIKRVAEIELGVMTQCLLLKTAGDMLREADMRENVYMKVNAKLGGVAFVAEPVGSEEVMELMAGKDGGLMVVGIDVTHPPSDINLPSIATLLGSMDKHLVTYKAVVTVQKERREHVVYTFDAMSTMLVAWTQKNPNTRLSNLIVLRGGVSEGQMNKVVREETRGIGKVLEVFNQSPHITYIVVNKRHHTRFFPIDSNDGNQVSERSKNVVPGLVVDRDVTDPQFFDWYQAPQQCVQGTTRPVKYTCLRNDANLSADCMQYLVHTLCHSFQRCTRAARCPAPIYYARLVARRAAHHLTEPVALMNSSSSSGGDSDHGGSGSCAATDGSASHNALLPEGDGDDTARPATPDSSGTPGDADGDTPLGDGKHPLDSMYADYVQVHADVYEKGMYFI